MTIEEWIRYQIEVEQDRFKFKRDGERELERFKERVEEVKRLEKLSRVSKARGVYGGF